MPPDGPHDETLAKNDNGSVKVIASRSKGLLGRAESHADFVDVYIVKGGKEILKFGGEIENPETKSSGELRGKTLIDAEEVTIEEGDVVIIPKGVCHQHTGVIEQIILKIG